MERAWKHGSLACVGGILIAIVAMLVSVPSAGADERPEPIRMLRGASSGEHLWFVVPSDRDADRWYLLHHTRAMDGPFFSPQPLSVPRQPEAMAADENRVWLVFPPRGEGESRQRGVYTVAVEWDYGVEFYRPTPRERLQILQALPATGQLLSMTATRTGPVVLILPNGEEDTWPEGDDSSDDPAPDTQGTPPEAAEQTGPAQDLAHAAARRPLLLEMRSKRWQELQLPEDVELTAASRVMASGTDRGQLVLLAADPSDHSRTAMYRLSREQNGERETVHWDRTTIDLDLRHVLTIETVRGRVVTVMQEQPGEAAVLRYLRPEMTLDLASLPEPRGRWNIFGMADALRMVEYSTRDGAMMRRINPVTGEVSEAEAMRLQPLPTGRVWYTSLLLLAAVLAVLLVLFVRPSRQEKVELPKGIGIMPAVPRLLAVAMDLFPGAVVSVLVLRCSPLDVLRLPIFTDSLELAAPFLLMAAVAFIHMTLTELVKSTTLGKALLGGRVISAEGDPPHAKQVLLRNLIKLLILLIPVLAIFALLNPNLRGFNDLVARTVVVGDVEAGHEGAAENSGKTDRED